MPVPVRNMEAGPSVFSDTTKNIAIEWERAGDPNGGDVQIVSDDILQMPSFQRALQKGIFKQEDDKSLAQLAIDQQTASFRKREEDARQAANMSIDQASNNDLIQTECIGPNNRGTGLCGNPVPIRESKRNEAPPLCSQHTNLASEFVPTESEELRDGKPVVTWSRSGLAPRIHQNQ